MFHRGVSKTIWTSKIKLFVALVSSFGPLTNVTKNSISGVVGVPGSPLEFYNISITCVQVFKLSNVERLQSATSLKQYYFTSRCKLFGWLPSHHCFSYQITESISNFQLCRNTFRTSASFSNIFIFSWFFMHSRIFCSLSKQTSFTSKLYYLFRTKTLVFYFNF